MNRCLAATQTRSVVLVGIGTVRYAMFTRTGMHRTPTLVNKALHGGTLIWAQCEQDLKHGHAKVRLSFAIWKFFFVVIQYKWKWCSQQPISDFSPARQLKSNCNWPQATFDFHKPFTDSDGECLLVIWCSEFRLCVLYLLVHICLFLPCGQNFRVLLVLQFAGVFFVIVKLFCLCLGVDSNLPLRLHWNC